MNKKFEKLERPEVSQVVFHPRLELSPPPEGDHVSDHLIPVEKDINIGARFHMASRTAANLLYFHGNGEIVADYDELAPLFNTININLLAVDYRGYGRSDGSPSVGTMMSDCHLILNYIKKWLLEENHFGPLIIMGRSLGSASALELASEHSKAIDGLIIESGFAYAAPLLRLLGVNLDMLDFKEDDGFVNLEKIQHYAGPTLVIHAEFDHIIPYGDGRALYEASPSPNKNILKIKGANHNDILFRGLNEYMQAINDLVTQITDNSKS